MVEIMNMFVSNSRCDEYCLCLK